MSGCCRDHESANGIVQLMVQAGLEPDVETYQGLLCGYARYGLLPEIQNAMGALLDGYPQF